MRIAIPITNDILSQHFGHCERFVLVDVDLEEKKILQREDVVAPPHEPGLLPAWLAEREVNVIIAGGMGSRAQGLFAHNGIDVVVGAAAGSPEALVADYLADTLEAGQNICDH
jgi:predicted Fe-Mo cluster-binding NifX family protein